MSNPRQTFRTPESLYRIELLLEFITANPGATANDIAAAFSVPLQSAHCYTNHMASRELIHQMPKERRKGSNGRPRIKWVAGPLPKVVKPKRERKPKVVRSFAQLNIVHDPLHMAFFGQQKG